MIYRYHNLSLHSGDVLTSSSSQILVILELGVKNKYSKNSLPHTLHDFLLSLTFSYTANSEIIVVFLSLQKNMTDFSISKIHIHVIITYIVMQFSTLLMWNFLTTTQIKTTLLAKIIKSK